MEGFSAIFHAQYLFIFEDRVKVGGGRWGIAFNRVNMGAGY